MNKTGLWLNIAYHMENIRKFAYMFRCCKTVNLAGFMIEFIALSLVTDVSITMKLLSFQLTLS